MSEKSDKPQDDGTWVPSAEHPVPPTTEFAAIPVERVEPIEGSEGPDEEDARPVSDAGTAKDAGTPADVPAGSATADATEASAAPATAAAADVPVGEAPVTSDEPASPALDSPEAAAAATGGTPPIGEAPAWKTPPASGLPPAWADPDPDAEDTGPQPVNDISNLWGLVPDDRPEVLLGAALAGGVLVAILVRSLARR